MSQFEYNAPQFRDLEEGFDDSDGADTFFGKLKYIFGKLKYILLC